MPGLSTLQRSDLEALLAIAEAATSHLDLEELLRVVVQRVAEVVPADRCSVILVEEDADEAFVIASHDVPDLRRLPIEISRYPEIRHALESKSAVVIEDALSDPLMEDVRHLLEKKPIASLVVTPLIAQGDAVGALFLRLARSTAFGPHEQAFVRAVASTVANSVRNARLHSSVRKKKEDLERAYHERYLELERLNEQFREANRIKDELLAVCSHDLRAPLNVLLGHTRLLRKRMEGTPEYKSITIIERQARRILQLVERLLVRSKGKNAWHLSFQPLDLFACVREIANDFAAFAAEKGVGIRVLGEGSTIVKADESAVRQIVENLISNAVAYTAPGTEVEVEVQSCPASSWLRVEVRDRGPGIAVDELPLIFERYRSGKNGEGVGLGLAICRELVEAHGGDIWASQRPGGGSIFSFSLPIDSSRAHSARRILVIGMPAERHVNFVQRLGEAFAVSFAESRREGVARARVFLPDAVVIPTDIEGGAAACAAELRRQPGLGEVPFILFGEADDLDGPAQPRIARDLDELEVVLRALWTTGRSLAAPSAGS